MSSVANEPAVAANASIEAHLPPPRAAGLRKKAVYLAGLVGAAIVLIGLSVASQRAQRVAPVGDAPLVFGKPEMMQTTPAAKLQADYAGFDPAAIASGYADARSVAPATRPADGRDEELDQLRAQLLEAERAREQGLRDKALAEYEAAMASPLLFKSVPLVPADAGRTAGFVQEQDFGGARGGASDTTQPSGIAPRPWRANVQDEKTRFLTDAAAVEPYLRKPLLRPRSPFTLTAGSFVPVALVTAINSDLPGEVIAQVTQNVFDSRSGEHLLLPQGTRVLGKYQSLVSNGQNRALIVWTRLVMPNGTSIILDGMNGVDASGAAGAADQVDYHFDKLAAAATLSTALAYGGNLAREGGRDRDDLDIVGESAAQEASRIGGRIVDRELDVQPTITIRQGYPLNVLVNKDMLLEPYIE